MKSLSVTCFKEPKISVDIRADFKGVFLLTSKELFPEIYWMQCGVNWGKTKHI